MLFVCLCHPQLPIPSLTNQYLPTNWTWKCTCYMPFHIHDIYVMKSLNCVCVFYMRIETKIQYGHKELEQFNKKLRQQLKKIMKNWIEWEIETSQYGDGR